MKDFDEERAKRISDPAERSFKLGGETFTIKAAVRPEALLPAADLAAATTGAEVIVTHDRIITAFLDGDGPDRYKQLRQREEDPITVADQVAVIHWIQEVATGRPTEQPLPSSLGQGMSGTPLTAVPPPEASIQTG